MMSEDFGLSCKKNMSEKNDRPTAAAVNRGFDFHVKNKQYSLAHCFLFLSLARSKKDSNIMVPAFFHLKMLFYCPVRREQKCDDCFCVN